MSRPRFKDEITPRLHGSGGIHNEPVPLLLRPCEAARVLALSPRKLWSLTNMGTIPSIRIDGCVRYDPEDLKKWIQNQKKSTRTG